MLERALAELGKSETPITERYIEDFEQAQQERFIGSPSVRVSGEEAVAGIPGQGFGLTCRIYYKADGRISPLPQYHELVSGLERLLVG
jgi:hypothetical protein